VQYRRIGGQNERSPEDRRSEGQEVRRTRDQKDRSGEKKVRIETGQEERRTGGQ
jgi:hypothetical protein